MVLTRSLEEARAVFSSKLSELLQHYGEAVRCTWGQSRWPGRAPQLRALRWQPQEQCFLFRGGARARRSRTRCCLRRQADKWRYNCLRI